MKFERADIPEFAVSEGIAKRSRYWDLVTELIAAYKEGRGVRLEFEADEPYPLTNIRNHLWTRTKRGPHKLELRYQRVDQRLDAWIYVLWAEKEEEER